MDEFTCDSGYYLSFTIVSLISGLFFLVLLEGCSFDNYEQMHLFVGPLRLPVFIHLSMLCVVSVCFVRVCVTDPNLFVVVVVVVLTNVV